MTIKRHASTSLKHRQRWGKKSFHCSRLTCMERAVELRVLARPHVGPPISVWVCKKHSEEIPDREQVA